MNPDESTVPDTESEAIPAEPASDLVLMRAGHYCTPRGVDPGNSFACQGATVAHVWPGGLVNLSVLEQDGTSFPRTSVKVSEPSAGSASFHLTRDCPWRR